MSEKIEEITSERLANLTIYNVPEEVGHEFQKIMKRYRGNTGRAAFTEMVERYYIAETIGRILAELDELREKIEKLEDADKKTVKTFGGNKTRSD